MEENISNEIYEKTEDTIYNLLGKNMDFNGLEQTMVYMHMRAYYIILTKLYIKKLDKEFDFEKIFVNYKMKLINYYKENNPGIPEILLKDLVQSFDVSFQLIESIELQDVLDANLLEKFTKEVLSNLHAIIERRSKRVISTTFINNYEMFCENAREVREIIRNS